MAGGTPQQRADGGAAGNVAPTTTEAGAIAWHNPVGGHARPLHYQRCRSGERLRADTKSKGLHITYEGPSSYLYWELFLGNVVSPWLRHYRPGAYNPAYRFWREVRQIEVVCTDSIPTFVCKEGFRLMRLQRPSAHADTRAGLPSGSYFCMMINSVRRFRRRPSSVSLAAVGRVSP